MIRIPTILYLCVVFLQCSIQGAVVRRRATAPLNVQGAVDLDEMDINFDDDDQEQQQSPASMDIVGDVTVRPVSSTPIDMSVVPEPVPKVDAVEPPSLPSYGGVGSLRVLGQHLVPKTIWIKLLPLMVKHVRRPSGSLLQYSSV